MCISKLLLFLCTTPYVVTASFTVHSAFFHAHAKTIVPLHFKTKPLFAKQKKSNKRATRTSVRNRTKSSSGFGGAATEPCPCGSQIGYMKCCGKIHKDATAYSKARAEEVVRARYSAYAKREVDFIIGSTHPLNKDFITDIEHWKETISCKILDETYEGEGENQTATVKFIATMIQVDSRERTAFMETSLFERAGKHIRQGAWLYKSGVVEPVPVEGEDQSGDEEKNDETIVARNETNIS